MRMAKTKRLLPLLLLCFLPREAWGWNIQVSWDPNVEPVSGYVVSWGTASGKYDRQADTKLVTTWTVVPHTQTTRVFLIVQAYNNSGWSPPSKEIVVNPPATSPTPTPSASPAATTALSKPLAPLGVRVTLIP